MTARAKATARKVACRHRDTFTDMRLAGHMEICLNEDCRAERPIRIEWVPLGRWTLPATARNRKEG